MAAKKTAKTKEPSDATPAAVEVTIKHEHVAFPHSIELRRNGGEFVIEARLEDHRHSETLGAKTVEAILKENGAELPEADEELVINFSPYNGQIMAIGTKSAAETKPGESETKTDDAGTGASTIGAF